jgi:hypothetical protein
MNRLDPDLFRACFSSWVAVCWPDKLGLVAIDGKTSRRSHNRKTDQKALHLVSAFLVRHFALNLVRQVADKRSIKRHRKYAAMDPRCLLEIGRWRVNLDSLP